MLITEKKIKTIIREEVVKVVKEKNNLLPIYENKENFLKRYPQAKDEKINNEVKIKVEQASQDVKKQITKQYLSNQRKKSFVRFIRSFPKFQKQSEEKILNNFNFLRDKVLEVIKKTPIVMVNEGTHTQKVYDMFTKRDNVMGIYDPSTDKIIVNPYHKGLMNFGFLDTKHILNRARLKLVLREEIYHAIDLNLSMKDKLGLIPMQSLQTSIAKRKGIFLSQQDSSLSREEYEYYTTPTEFYAKMLLLKDTIAERYPEKIDQQTGKIDKKFLRYLIMNPRETKVLKIGFPREALDILKVLDHTKVDQIQSFFDMIAKRTGKMPQRMA